MGVESCVCARPAHRRRGRGPRGKPRHAEGHAHPHASSQLLHVNAPQPPLHTHRTDRPTDGADVSRGGVHVQRRAHPLVVLRPVGHHVELGGQRRRGVQRLALHGWAARGGQRVQGGVGLAKGACAPARTGLECTKVTGIRSTAQDGTSGTRPTRPSRRHLSSLLADCPMFVPQQKTHNPRLLAQPGSAARRTGARARAPPGTRQDTHPLPYTSVWFPDQLSVDRP